MLCCKLSRSVISETSGPVGPSRGFSHLAKVGPGLRLRVSKHFVSIAFERPYILLSRESVRGALSYVVVYVDWLAGVSYSLSVRKAEAGGPLRCKKQFL